MNNSIITIVEVSLILLATVQSSYAQYAGYFKSTPHYIGMEGGFGIRSFTTAGNIDQIDQLTTVKGGGSFGFVYGTPLVKIPVVMGLYFQPVQEAYTIDLFTLQTGANVSLLHLLGTKNSFFDIYTITGIDFQNFTFLGTYLKPSDDTRRKEILGEPLLGRKSILNASIGAGIAFRLMDDYDFIHLFAETRKTFPLITGSTELFSETAVTNNLAINIGLRIGAVR